jgi:hypothetical protein
MEDCLNSPADTLQHMGETAYQRVIRRHDIDTEAAKLVHLFESQAVLDEIEEWQS